MKLREAIVKVTEEQNWAGMSRIVDLLRFRHGLTSEETRAVFNRVLGREIPLPEWDGWMQQCDAVMSGG